MGRKSRKKGTPSTPPNETKVETKKKPPILFLILLGVGVGFGSGWFLKPKPPTPETFSGWTLDQIESASTLEMSIKLVNDIEGVNANLEEAQKIVDTWTSDVVMALMNREALETYKKNNPNDTRAMMTFAVMGSILKQKYGLKYVDDKQVNNKNLGHKFITGLFGDKPSGTCANLPVAFLCVAEELNMPLSLAYAPAYKSMGAHLYAIYDDGKQKFNLESTSRAHVAFPVEQVIRKGGIPQKFIDDGHYHVPLNRRQTFAILLMLRAEFYNAHNIFDKAEMDMATAMKLYPKNFPIFIGRYYSVNSMGRAVYAMYEEMYRDDPEAMAFWKQHFQREGLIRESQQPKKRRRFTHPIETDPLYYSRQNQLDLMNPKIP